MLTLPNITYAMQKNRKEIVAMRGINYSDQLQDGDLADSLNLSARRYPYIATRKGRVKQESYANVTALTAWEKLVAVRGTDLLYDGAVVGQVTAGEKQFAVVNTRLVIWPDKVYLDLNTSTVKPLGASVSGSGAKFTTDTMTIAWSSADLTVHFKVGDAVTISGCTTNTANNKDVVIKELTATTLKVSENGFVAVTSEAGKVKVERVVPDLDFICESQNRLWGVSNEKQTIYASSLGDPTNFNVFEGLSTDSYALAVGSEGSFTGCIKLSSSVLFWKETKLHKVLGSYPAEDTGEIVSRIRKIAAKTAPFEVQFAGMGHFSNVIRFLEPVISEPLAALHRHFDSDYANGYPGWMPHVTLYRHSAPAELTGQWDLPQKAVITGIELGEFFPARKIVREAFRNE